LLPLLTRLTGVCVTSGLHHTSPGTAPDVFLCALAAVQTTGTDDTQSFFVTVCNVL